MIQTNKIGVVLIDICGTIFDSNTTFDFLDHNVNRSSYKILRKVMYTLPWRAFNKLSVKAFGLDLTRHIALKHLKNKSKSDLLHQTGRFYEEILQNKVNKQVLQLIEDYRQKGYTLVLASATLDFIAQTIAEKLHIENYISTDLEYQEGKFTGRVIAGRLGHKLKALTEIGFTPPYQTTITDNYSDVDILRESDRKIIVVSESGKQRWDKIIRTNNLINTNLIHV